MALFLLASPIGNLKDVSFRLVECLENSDIIYCEDTRVSSKLLARLDIKKPLASYHEHSKGSVLEKIEAGLAAGKNISYLSDAGMPCISDPGREIVLLAIEKGFEYTVIPGPSACDTVYAASQFDDGRFLFVGFLDRNKRLKELEYLKKIREPLIFYEAKHRISECLNDILKVFGNRRISLARELTKKHESFIHGDLLSLVEHEEITDPKGEFAFVIEGYREAEEGMSREDIIKEALQMKACGLKISKIVRDMAVKDVISRNELYMILSGEHE